MKKTMYYKNKKCTLLHPHLDSGAICFAASSDDMIIVPLEELTESPIDFDKSIAKKAKELSTLTASVELLKSGKDDELKKLENNRKTRLALVSKKTKIQNFQVLLDVLSGEKEMWCITLAYNPRVCKISELTDPKSKRSFRFWIAPSRNPEVKFCIGQYADYSGDNDLCLVGYSEKEVAKALYDILKRTRLDCRYYSLCERYFPDDPAYLERVKSINIERLARLKREIINDTSMLQEQKNELKKLKKTLKGA